MKPRKAFALVDCNNFYVSCERVFNPKLHNKAVAVLSNNDGCIVARSQEVKDFGIPMGAAFFKYESLLKKHNVQIFSSNYPLYADMSQRVMNSIMDGYGQVEIYSIDEAFIYLTYNEQTRSQLYTLGKKIHQWTGIPVSIGIGSTKTLAKLANKYAKRQNLGVFDSMMLDEHIDSWLDQFPVSDIWGVGRQYTKLLYNHRIKTAKDFKYRNPLWIKKNMTINGVKTLNELHGITCIQLDEMPVTKQTIACTRSFKMGITSKKALEQTIARFVSRAAEKLRAQQSLATAIYVFIASNRFVEPSYYNGSLYALPISTDYTPDLLQAMLRALDTIYLPNYQYKRAGIILLDLIDNKHHQRYLFAQSTYTPSKRKASCILDAINAKWGKQTVHYALEGKRYWRAYQKKKSPCFTTRWEDIPLIHL